MNGQEIFLGLSYISRKYIEEAETETVSGGAGKAHRIRRPFLLAAVIALLLLLVGCAAVYVLKMEHVKISSGTDQRDYSLVDGVYVKDPHTVDTTTLSMAGLKGSNAYKACADFYAYETELRASASASGDWTGYDDAINAKAQELAEQYGLKPEGQPLTFRTTRNLCNALGVERFVRNSQDVSIDVDQGFCRDSGNFFVLLRFAFPEDQGYEVTYTSGALYWDRQDTFSREYFTLEDRGDWVERNYTTSAGNTVLILTSPSQERGYIICDRGDALMTVWLDVNPELLSEDAGVVSAEYLHMTDAQLNMVADALDFAIQPNVPTQGRRGRTGRAASGSDPERLHSEAEIRGDRRLRGANRRRHHRPGGCGYRKSEYQRWRNVLRHTRQRIHGWQRSFQRCDGRRRSCEYQRSGSRIHRILPGRSASLRAWRHMGSGYYRPVCGSMVADLPCAYGG